jgi:uncharacterized protein DUF3108
MIKAIFLCLFFLCTSCSQNESSYFPLSEGYKWIYDVTLTTQDEVLNQKYIFNNIGESELEGKPVYLRKSIDGTILNYSKSDKGIYYLGNIDSQSIQAEFNEDKQLVFPEMLSVGTEWKQTTVTKLLKKQGLEIVAEIPLEIKVESFNETVSVPAGLFTNCMKISMNGFEFKNIGNKLGITMVSVEQTNWYALGIGLVKMERLETTERKALKKGTLKIELSDFESG